jgi:predicted nucleic acid-binding protein
LLSYGITPYSTENTNGESQMAQMHKHYDEDELELLPPEKVAEDESGHRDAKAARKAGKVRDKFWSVMKIAARQIPIMEDVVA